MIGRMSQKAPLDGINQIFSNRHRQKISLGFNKKITADITHKRAPTQNCQETLLQKLGQHCTMFFFTNAADNIYFFLMMFLSRHW